MFYEYLSQETIIGIMKSWIHEIKKPFFNTDLSHPWSGAPSFPIARGCRAVEVGGSWW